PRAARWGSRGNLSTTTSSSRSTPASPTRRATARSATRARMWGTPVRATPRAAAAGPLLAGSRLRRGGGRLGCEPLWHDAVQPGADRPLRQARVHAGLAGLGAARPEARGGRQVVAAVRKRRQQRPAGVALAGVGAAPRVARA